MRPSEIIRLIVIFSSFLFFLDTVRSYAQKDPTIYYVSPAGNDSNPGTESLPWKTLSKAASMATANVTVFIKQGIYRERLVPVNSGTLDAPITFTCYPHDSVTITGAGMMPPTGWWAGLIWVQGLSYIKISGLRVINSENFGIDVENCSHITIEKNYVDSTYSSGMKVYASDNIVIDANEVVRGCIGSDLEECISVATVNFLEIKNNRVHDGRSIGIDVKYGSSNAILCKNEVYNQNGGIGIYIEAWTLHEYNIDVFDNFSHDNGIGFAVTSEMGGLIEAVRLHHNMAYSNQQRGIVIVGWGGGQSHPVKNIKVYGNIVYANGFGIEIGGYTGTTLDSIGVFNNLIYRNKNAGVRITRYDGPSGEYAMRNVSILNNTIYGNGTVGNGWDADNGGMNIFNISPENLIIRNNILSSNTICTIFVSPEVPAGNLAIDYNFFDGFRNYPYETAGTNPVYGSPLFVDSLKNDYHLQASSPCIDKGHPDQEYNDPADPNRPGYALCPAQGTLRNDMGAYGGPYASSPDTMVIATPLTPSLVGPENGEKSISITPTLSWERPIGAVTYRLQASLNSWFSTTVVDDSTITKTFKSIGPLQNGTTYFWRVNARNEGGTSDWSQVRSFTTTIATPLGPAFYVSPTGNDSNPGTESLPWKTLSKAASMATANTTVFIKQGIYSERLVPAHSGTAEGLITFTSYPGDSATITGAGMKPPTGWWAGLIWIQGLAYVKISGLRVINSENVGIDVENSNHIIIEKCYVDSTYSPGIKMYASNNAIIESNEVVHCCIGKEEECLSVSMTNLVEIRNNRVYNGLTEGIDVKNGSSNAVVTKNEVYSQGSCGIYIEAWDKHEFNIDVFDNTSYENVQGFAVAAENDGMIEAIKIHHNNAYKNDRGFIVAGWGIGQTHTIKNIEIYGNVSHENRVGIELGGYTGTTMDSIKIFNNVIHHNTTGVGITRYDGASGQYEMRNIEIINNTICRNGASSSGWSDGGINVSFINPSNLFIRNNILSSNAAYTICVQPDVSRASVTIDYNTFDGFKNYPNETAGVNTVYGNPLFVDTLRNDYHLQAASPCIDKGNPSQEYNDPADPNTPGFALYPAQGTPRNDMGAYGGPYATASDVTTSTDDDNIDSSTLPELFELYQNFPNPFNLSTKINYSIPKSSFVTLKVYDLLGKEITTLVNERKSAGNYSVNLNASNLPSGVYFYRMLAGSFVSTKKFILLK
jgi:parallel beta-helix repeat protein